MYSNRHIYSSMCLCVCVFEDLSIYNYCVEFNTSSFYAVILDKFFFAIHMRKKSSEYLGIKYWIVNILIRILLKRKKRKEIEEIWERQSL